MVELGPPPDLLPPGQARLLRLVDVYLRGVAVAVETVLQRGLGAGHPLRAWREGRLPGRGELPRPFEGRFRFRGHGCVVQFYRLRVEFDFGPGGRYDGFHAFYVGRHARLNKPFRRAFGGLDVYAGLRELERSGLVFCPGWEPTPHLLYLTAAGRDRIRAG